MSKVFFGGIPTDMDVKKLNQAFGVPDAGAEITHDQIEATLGMDRKTNRYKAVTLRWRASMLRDHNIELGPVHGVGFKSLNSEERVSAGMAGMKSGSRKVLRSIKRADQVQTDDPVLTKKQDLMRRFGVAIAAEANTMARQIEPPKPQQQMLRVAPTLRSA